MHSWATGGCLPWLTLGVRRLHAHHNNTAIERNIMNKVLHAVILAVFTAACSLVWLLMKLPLLLGPNHPLPGFTALCVNLRPIMIALPIMAAAYCVWVWFRKSD